MFTAVNCIVTLNLSILTIHAFNITKEQQLDIQMRIEVFRETVKYLPVLCNSDRKNRMKIYLIKVKTRSESMHSVYLLFGFICQGPICVEVDF